MQIHNREDNTVLIHPTAQKTETIRIQAMPERADIIAVTNGECRMCEAWPINTIEVDGDPICIPCVTNRLSMQTAADLLDTLDDTMGRVAFNPQARKAVDAVLKMLQENANLLYRDGYHDQVLDQMHQAAQLIAAITLIQQDWDECVTAVNG